MYMKKTTQASRINASSILVTFTYNRLQSLTNIAHSIDS